MALLDARLEPFSTSIDLSRGGSVLYLETRDSQLISRSASEVSIAFPDQQPAFTPEFLFIATWLEVFSIDMNIPGVS